MANQVVLAVALLAVVAATNALNPLLYKQRNLDEPFEAFQAPSGPLGYRLPNDTAPEHYDVSLTTNVHANNFGFSGNVEITLNVLSETLAITLHHRQLTIGAISLSNVLTPTINVLLDAPQYNNTVEMLRIPLAATVPALATNSKYILRIAFTGTLRTDDGGFYRSSYVAADGTTRWLATTQFESTDARHSFPCYDEPALRATFAIRITHGSGYTAISNMPVAGAPVVNGAMATTTFQTTPSIPTYLLAYVVSDFQFKGNNDRPTEFQQKVYARPTAIAAADFGLQAGIDILKGFENYLGISFSLPKMDQVAVPDFAAGAMENWGLVTYREQYLLFFNDSTFVNRRNIATIIAHEYAHQWFGNLVTPKWWTYLWLNEGFATLFEFYGTHWVFPEWKILDAFVLTLQNVMQSDATTTTRPMTFYVESDTDISRLFDNVAYPKSGSVLRMMLHAFTEASFKKGLTTYLNTKAYSDATEEDLFVGLQSAVTADNTLAANLNVADIMLSWTRQAGFPLVTVERNYETMAITFKQERYFTAKETTPGTSSWWIPINIATSTLPTIDRTTPDFWIPANTASMTHQGDAPAATWLLVNKQQTGFYRVLYDTQNYQLLANALNSEERSKIHLTSRSAIIDDVFDFARTERLNYTIVFDIIKYLEHEVEYVPWQSAFNGLNFVDRMFAGSEKYDKYAEFIVKLLTHLYSTTGVLDVENEAHYHKQSRINAMNWGCRLGLEKCLTDTSTLLKSHMTSGVAIHQNNVATVYCAGMRSSTVEEYAAFMLKFQGETNADERLRILSGLGCRKNNDTLTAFIQTSVGTEVNYRTPAERYRVFTSVVANGAVGLEAAIKFLIDNMDAASTTYGANNLNNGIVLAAQYVVTEAHRVEFNLLLTTAATKSYVTANAITNARTHLTNNENWVTRNQQEIENWLESGATTYVLSTMMMAFMLVITRLF